MFSSRIFKRAGSGYWRGSLIFAVSLTGCIDSVDHDPASARKKAEEFTQVVFVKQDIETGYALLAEGTRRYVSRDQFKTVVLKMHPSGFPKTVTALEYEPMPGEKAIYVFLTGDHWGERFYYRLTMEGTASTGYRVLRLDRASQPYAPSNEKKQFNDKKVMATPPS